MGIQIPRLSIKIILLAGLKLTPLTAFILKWGYLSIKIILLAGLKHGITNALPLSGGLSIKIILLAGLKHTEPRKESEEASAFN